MQRFFALHAGKTLYKDRSDVVEFLLQFENKQQITSIGADTQHNHMYS